MPVYTYIIINAILATAVVGGIVGLLLWSLRTQHRDPGCAHLRLRRHRLSIRVSFVPLELPSPVRDASVASQATTSV